MSLNTFPCNPYPISTEELNKGNNDDLNTRVSALETAVEEIDNDKADLGVIAAEFDAEAGIYEIGDLVTNEGKLYEFTSDHSTPGAWDPTEVTAKTVADEVNFVKSGLAGLVTVYTGVLPAVSSEQCYIEHLNPRAWHLQVEISANVWSDLTEVSYMQGNAIFVYMPSEKLAPYLGNNFRIVVI